MNYVVELDLKGGFKSLLRNENEKPAEFPSEEAAKQFLKTGCRALTIHCPMRIRPKKETDV